MYACRQLVAATFRSAQFYSAVRRSFVTAAATSAAPTINVDKWLQESFTPYQGDASFLQPATERSKSLWKKVSDLLKEELQKGILGVDTATPSTITSHAPGYVDKDSELIVGFQTDKPLVRAIKPLGGIRMVDGACKSYGYHLDPKVWEIFTEYRKTHSDAVFDAYTEEMKLARHNGIVTGLPDGYGRGRIIGDYRRVALYGVDALIAAKEHDRNEIIGTMTQDTIRAREELSEQIKALKKLKEMAHSYGYDISKPAASAREAVQWVYFAYLGAIKEQDGAAMSLGRLDSFLDVYFERDLAAGRITESQAQEIIDDFVMKLRMVRHLRPPEYNALFAGDPTWVTIAIAGLRTNGTPLVTKTSYRLLNTLYNLGPAPEPNLTVLWSPHLPAPFKEFCARVSIDTSSIQYENDEVMRPLFGSDYGIACCVSAMKMGKQMQFFGARCNLAKLLLYTINGGRDEVSGEQVGLSLPPLNMDQPLQFEEVKARYEKYMDWLSGLYVNTMNVIHYMHDHYCYEDLEMALHDTNVERLMAFGIAGLSVVTDSLSAIKYAQVRAVKDERGLATSFETVGNYPKYGNDDDSVDSIAQWVVNTFSEKLRQHPTYRNAKHTLSVLTITSNVVYGQHTGDTPDGRKKGEPFAPGANPMHGRDTRGALASLNSVSKLSYESCLDGISNTFSIAPSTLGKTDSDRRNNLTAMLDGYFTRKAHHLNVNVLNRKVLEDAMKHPELYPQLTIRVSGYAVNFVRLSPLHQREVIARTFHDSM